MKRFLVLWIVLAMLLAAMPALATDASASDLPHLTIRWLGHAGVDPPIVNDSPMQKLLEERFNVTIVPVLVNNLNAEQWNLFWASGETSDLISLPGGDYKNLVAQDLVRPVDPDTIYSLMPNWMAKVEALAGDAEMVKRTMIHPDGNCYGVPYLHAPIMESGTMLIRQDWLDALSLKAPTTLDEFHNVLKAFTENDPDGNGQHDTYGINGNGRYHFNYVFGAYGFMPKTYELKDGQVVYTSVSEEYKASLKTLAAWYSEGLIDPETFTDDRTKQRDKWAAGKFGILSDNAFWADSARGAIGVIQMVVDRNPAAKVVAFPAIQGVDGNPGGSYLDYPSVTGQGMVLFGADTSDEVVERIMMIKEAFASDFDLYTRGRYGVEGEHYLLGDTGKIVVTNMNFDIQRDEGISQYFAIQPESFDELAKTLQPADEAIHTIAQTQNSVFNGVAFPVPSINQSAINYGADIDRLVDEYYANAVMGRVDVDATWDQYVSDIKSAGLDKVIAEYQAML